jgi:hypothetical protein
MINAIKGGKLFDDLTTLIQVENKNEIYQGFLRKGDIPSEIANIKELVFIEQVLTQAYEKAKKGLVLQAINTTETNLKDFNRDDYPELANYN